MCLGCTSSCFSVFCLWGLFRVDLGFLLLSIWCFLGFISYIQYEKPKKRETLKNRETEKQVSKQRSIQKQKAEKQLRQKNRNAEKQRGKEAEKQESKESKKQRSKEAEKTEIAEKQGTAEKQRSKAKQKKHEKEKHGEAERQRSRNAEKQRIKETKKQRNRKTGNPKTEKPPPPGHSLPGTVLYCIVLGDWASSKPKNINTETLPPMCWAFFGDQRNSLAIFRGFDGIWKFMGEIMARYSTWSTFDRPHKMYFFLLVCWWFSHNNRLYKG